MKRYNILFWPGWWYPNRLEPLSGIFIKKHAEAVSKYFDVSVLFILPDHQLTNQPYEIIDSLENSVQTFRVYYKPGKKWGLFSKIIEPIKYIRASLRGLDALKKKAGPPDLIHVNVNPPAGLIFLLFTHFRKIPYIFTEHWSGYLPANGSYRGVFRKMLTKWLVKRAKAVTTVSENLKSAMLSHDLMGQYYTVPNVVDKNIFYPFASKEKKTKIKLLHVSGLVPVKNIPGLLRVINALWKIRKDFQLDIIGDSKYRDELEELAEKLNLLNKIVFFLGAMEVEEVAAFMRQADILVMFSHYENSPCVIVEAMASGLPVIATKVGGIPELVNKKTGTLVLPRDENELFRAINTMLDNYESYNKQAIRDEALKRFSYETIGQQFLEIYQQAIGTRNR